MPEPSHQEIEMLAYHYWEERGRPFGSPEVDWFRAENDLRQEPAIVAAAKAVGAAVGSVVSAAAHLLPSDRGSHS